MKGTLAIDVVIGLAIAIIVLIIAITILTDGSNDSAAQISNIQKTSETCLEVKLKHSCENIQGLDEFDTIVEKCGCQEGLDGIATPTGKEKCVIQQCCDLIC